MNQPHALLDATRQAVNAASLGDFEALETALALRRAALEDAPMSERVAALREGESVGLLLKGIKRRIGDQYCHLEQIKSGLARTEAPRVAKVDLRA
jgi:hypothetical protein